MCRKILSQFNKLTARNNFILVYKLLHDTLLIGLIFFFAILLAESLIPGLVANHLGFYAVILALGINILAIYVIASFAQIETANKSINKKTVSILLFFLIFIVFNSLWNAGIVLNLSLLLLFSAAGYFLYKVLFEE